MFTFARTLCAIVGLSLAPLAFAQDAPVEPAPAEAPAEAPADAPAEAPAEAEAAAGPAATGEKKKPEISPFVKPIMGIAFFRHHNDQIKLKTAALLGIQLGMQVSIGDKIGLDIRVPTQFEGMIGSNDGWEWRIAAMAGPRLSIISILAGVELAHNTYRMENYFVNADPAWMVGVPMQLSLDLKIITLWGGVTPMFLTGGNRAKVDWAAHPNSGFGDELHIDAGVHLQLGKFGIGAGMRTRFMQPFNTSSLSIGGKVGF